MQSAERGLKCSACCCTAEGRKRQSTGNVVFEDEDRLMAHIAVRHVFWIPFECVLCTQISSTETMLEQHYDQAHPGMVPKAIYTYEKDKKKEMYCILASSKAMRDTNFGEISKAKTSKRRSYSSTGDSGTTVESPMMATKTKPDMMNKPAGKKRRLASSNTPNSTPGSDCSQTKRPPVAANKNEKSAKQFTCRLCDMTFSNKQHHVWHYHVMRKRYQCHLCPTGASQLMDMKNHWKRTHKEESPLVIGWTDNSEELADEYRTMLDAVGSGEKPPEERDNVLDGRNKKEPTQVIPINQENTSGRPATSKVASSTAMRDAKTTKRRMYAPTDESDTIFESAQKTTTKITTVRDVANNSAPDTDCIQRPLVADHRNEKSAKQHTCRLCDMTFANKQHHIWHHHVVQKRFQCHRCPVGTSLLFQMKLHLKRMHEGRSSIANDWTDNSEELADEYRTMFEAAFGSGEKPSDENDNVFDEESEEEPIPIKQEQVSEMAVASMEAQDGVSCAEGSKRQCRLCKSTLSVGDRTLHVWRKHMTQRRFACTLCDYTAVQVGHGKLHVQKVHLHEETEEYLTDRTLQFREKYAVAFRAAFGTYVRKSLDWFD